MDREKKNDIMRTLYWAAVFGWIWEIFRGFGAKNRPEPGAQTRHAPRPGGCVTLLFSGGGTAPELLRTAPPEKSMPDQPCG